VTILDAAGKPVFNQTDPVAVESFGTDRSAEHQFRVPLNKLEKGEYLMAFEATAGKNTARRDVRFERK
jgi:hypothetical protein